MAHAQLAGVIESMCPGVVAEELDVIDPLKLVRLGMGPEHSVGLYRALYKFTQKCLESHERVRESLAPLGPGEALGAPDARLARVRRGVGVQRGGAFPSTVADAKALKPELERTSAAMNALAREIDDARASAESAAADAEKATARAESLEPLVLEVETQTTRARKAGGARRVAREHEATEAKLAAAEEAAASAARPPPSSRNTPSEGKRSSSRTPRRRLPRRPKCSRRRRGAPRRICGGADVAARGSFSARDAATAARRTPKKSPGLSRRTSRFSARSAEARRLRSRRRSCARRRRKTGSRTR